MSKQVIGGVIFDVDDVTAQARVFEGPFGQLVKDVAGDTQPTPDTLALRTSDGRVKVADATESDDAASFGAVNIMFAHQGPTLPDLPTGTEYTWLKTDGAGTLLDIVSGVAS